MTAPVVVPDLDEATKEELQPPCDNSFCGSTALWALVFTDCGFPHHGVEVLCARCRVLALDGDGPFECHWCMTEVQLLRIEPLR